MKGVRIGLEVHAQILSLKTKLFCSCSSDYRDKPPNTNVCPTCMGLPGSLPVLNKKAVVEATRVALALHCKINRVSRFYRKNYFYPDLAKNFQISQYDRAGGVPFAYDGYLHLSGGRKVRIRRINIEEDPARIVYEGSITQSPYSLVDYNRHGIALLEIVTEPDMSEPSEAREFLERLASILEYLGVYKPGVEGALRCDANISLPGGGRVEIKNITGFSEVERALRFEYTRQKSRLSKGLSVHRETRHWDEARRVTVSLRTKETEEEYRYFPEPDLPPIIVTDEMLKEAVRTIPELPEDKKTRFVKEFGLSEPLAEAIAKSPRLSSLFESTVGLGAPPRRAASILAVDLLAYVNEKGVDLNGVALDPGDIAELARLTDQGLLDPRDSKRLLWGAIESGSSVKDLLRREAIGSGGLSNEDLTKLVDSVIKENPGAVEDARKNPKAINYLVGLAIKKSGGRASPKALYQIFVKKIVVKTA